MYSFNQDAYRKYALLYPLLEIPCIPMISYKIFAQNHSILDEHFSNQDLELVWASTTKTMIRTDNIRNPERGIVRYQFVESLVRLMEKKFDIYRKKLQFHKVFPIFYEKYLMEKFEKIDPNEGRTAFKADEEVDSILRRNKEMFTLVFRHFSINKIYTVMKYE